MHIYMPGGHVMDQSRHGLLRRFLQSTAASLLPGTSAGTGAQAELRAEAYVRQLLKAEKRTDVWDVPLTETRFVVVDTETTGFDVRTDYLLSLGAIEMTGSHMAEDRTYDQLIRPQSRRPMPLHIVKLTGIRDEDVADALPVETVLQGFLDFARGAVLVMHHSAHDVRFLNAALYKLTRKHLTHRVLDTHDVAKWLRPALNDFTLDGLLQTFGILLEGRHTALGDAKMTARLFQVLLGEAREQGVETLGELYEQVLLAKYHAHR
jgi:DNA polymerase III subunit epsilon